MSNRRIGDGRIEITLEGKTAYLVPTLQACVEISAAGPGIMQTIQKIEMFDFETICTVIGAGLVVGDEEKPISQKLRRTELPFSVAEAGLFELRPKAIEFCTLVANGGREIADDDDDEEAEGGDNDPLASATSTG